MRRFIVQIARRVRGFCEHPITRMTIGIVLFLTALYEIEEGLLIELGEEGAQSHHGIAAFGLLTMIAAIPDLLEGFVLGADCIESYDAQANDEGVRTGGKV